MLGYTRRFAMAQTSLLSLLLSLPGAILAPAIHEYFKAVLSFRQKDPNPRLQGRLRLNPFTHFEPVGFFLLLFYGYGWGQPVNANPAYYRDRRKGIALVYGAPSLINILFAATAGCALAVARLAAAQLGTAILPVPYAFAAASLVDPITWIPLATSLLYQIVYHFARLSLSLALFNLIPVYPLDGARLLTLLISPSTAMKFSQNEKQLQMLLMVLLVFNGVNRIFDPIVSALLAFAR
jgi:Zn-dependent protease